MDNEFLLVSCQDELQELIASQTLIEAVLLKLDNKNCHESHEIEDSKSILQKISYLINTFANLVQRVEKTLTVNFLSSEAWQK